jgi:putative ABC transport system permease protein
VDQTVQADLIVSAADPSSGVLAVPLPASLAHELRTIDGVVEVDALRSRSIPYQDRQVVLNIADLDVFARHTEYPFLEGDHDAIFAEVTSQDSVIVSEISLPLCCAAWRWRHPADARGATLLQGRRSEHRLLVRSGTIVMHWGTFRKYWTEQVVDTIGVYVQPGASLEAVAAEIKQRFGHSHRLFLFSNQDFKAEIYQLIDQSFVITYALEIIALIVGIMGITTALYTAVLERRRETSVLRALGALRRQIQKIILLESGLLGLLGVVVGTLCGACLSVILVYIINRQSFGWTLRLTFLPGRWSSTRSHLPDGTGGGHLAGPSGLEVRLTETLRME